MKVSPLYIYRETHFPLERVARYMGDLAERYGSAKAQKAKSERRIGAVTEEMERQIGRIEEDGDRMEAIRFKRDFFNGRVSAVARYERIKHVFSPEVRQETEQIFESREAAQKGLAAIEAEFEACSEDDREWLQHVYREDSELRDAVMFMNSAIVPKLEKYLQTPVKQHDRSLRKLDYTLIKFLTRASMKTSPFANLTYSGMGNFNGPEQHGVKRLYPRINDSILLQVFDKLCLDPELIIRLEYRLNATCVELEGKYYITVLQNSKGERQLYKSRQGLVTLRSNEAFRTLFGKLSVQSALSYDDMRETFTSLGIDESKADDTLLHLIRNGVLERTDVLNEQAGELLGELIRKLERYGLEHPCLEVLKSLRHLTGQLTDNFDRNMVERLYEGLEELSAMCGTEAMPRRSMLYIDGIDETVTTRSFREQEHRLNRLSQYQQLMMCFDTVVKMQFAAGEFFRQHYGSAFVPANSQEASKVLRDMAEVIFSDMEMMKETYGFFNWKKAYMHPRIRQLHETAGQLASFLNHAPDEQEIVIPDDQLNKWLGQIREVLGERLLSHSFFVQEDGEHMVVNHMYKGFSIYFARFLKYLKDTGQAYPDYLSECFDRNRVADIRNTFGFNANIRKRTVQREIALPIQSMTESDQFLSWLDLGLRYNASTGSAEFFEQENGETIRPQFLGTLVLVAAPAILTTFDVLSSHGTSYFDLGELVIHERMKEAGMNQSDVIHVPRISLGDHELIVSRAKWLIPSRTLLELHKEKDRFGSWQRVLDFVEEHGIPLRFYARAFITDMKDMSEGGERKPQFINLSSPLLFQLFIQQAGKTEYLVIEEEFPVADPQQGCVREYTYEITCGEAYGDAAANH
ncbi:hypothetical protein GRF59_18745 [Paenibacillus sp. HJL G12]|uniref:Lantibiotic dehydratase N-terminal domain-containing protein n=1 Tax=Paenibacillus dendrobii TaxID=2691084 RepID=A0A7X3IL64_9BACL|nr:lantibiotic dehydratase [Paenibacillus dendrobii]MWV45655.1 hypothetical protein [Paenibacillus dendrobii]